jgi:hypothetical protein
MNADERRCIAEVVAVIRADRRRIAKNPRVHGAYLRSSASSRLDRAARQK